MIGSIITGIVWFCLFYVVAEQTMKGVGALLVFLNDRFTAANKWFIRHNGEYWTIAVLQAGIVGAVIFIAISLACELLFW